MQGITILAVGTSIEFSELTKPTLAIPRVSEDGRVPRSRLEAENVVQRQQLIVLRRKVHGRVQLSNADRLFFVQLCRWFPSILKSITIVRPETLVRRHREGIRRYWRWKSRAPGDRPPIGVERLALIRRMSQENPLWGAPRIHGELFKLGFAVAPVDRRQVYGGDEKC